VCTSCTPDMNLRVHSGLVPSLSIYTAAKGGHQDHAIPGHVILDLKGGHQVHGNAIKEIKGTIYFHVFLNKKLNGAFIYGWAAGAFP
jgi:hypothetical protein